MAISPLLLLGAGALGLFALTSKKPAVLGDVDPTTGAGSTVVKGPVTGKNYMVGLGELAEDGRQLISVHNSRGKLLVTALTIPGESEKTFVMRAPDTTDQEASHAISDFNILVPA